MTDQPPDLETLNQETQAVWEGNAAFWDDYMGEGNDFQTVLINPATERLLQIRPDDVVLEIACGNGSFARRMAQFGARVVACDFSPTMIERARRRSGEYAGRIDFHVVDATNEEQLLALGEQRFTAAVANMALMDMARLEPLASTLRRLLRPPARFVFSVSHPCFHSTGTSLLAELEERDGKLIQHRAVKVGRYLNLAPQKGLAIVGQPAPHYYFDRPLHRLLGVFFRAGFALDGLEEPAFQTEIDERKPFSWDNFHEIPPVLVARLRV